MKKTIFAVVLLTAVTLMLGSCVLAAVLLDIYNNPNIAEKREQRKFEQQQKKNNPQIKPGSYKKEVSDKIDEGDYYMTQFQHYVDQASEQAARARGAGGGTPPISTARSTKGSPGGSGPTAFSTAGSGGSRSSENKYRPFNTSMPSSIKEYVRPSEQDIDRAIASYEEALRLEPSGTWKPSRSTTLPPEGGIQARLGDAQRTKRYWLTEQKPLIEQALASVQQSQQAQQAAQYEATTPNSPNDFDIVQTGNSIEIRRYTGTRRGVVIPETISGLRVTSIAGYAFSEKSLLSVVIPNTVTSIGDYAFRYNKELRSVVLPNAITVIETGTFSGCSALQSITIPNSVTRIAQAAFSGCGLTSVTLPNRLELIWVDAFRDNKITSIQIPASLKTIGEGAFRNNQITNLVIPENVTELGRYSFSGNPLTSLVIPASLAKLRVITETSQMGPAVTYSSTSASGGFREAFAGRRSNETLTRVTLPANVDDLNMGGGFDYNTDFDPNFEESLINYYRSQNKRAGTYVKENRIWTVR